MNRLLSAALLLACAACAPDRPPAPGAAVPGASQLKEGAAIDSAAPDLSDAYLVWSADTSGKAETVWIDGDGRVVARRAGVAAAGSGGVYNVGTALETTVNELHRLCAEIAGVDREPTQREPRAGDARRSVLDPSRAQRELGWRPTTSLADGLRRTWESI